MYRNPVCLPLLFEGDKLAEVAPRKLSGAITTTFYTVKLLLPSIYHPVLSSRLNVKVHDFGVLFWFINLPFPVSHYIWAARPDACLITFVSTTLN